MSDAKRAVRTNETNAPLRVQAWKLTCGCDGREIRYERNRRECLCGAELQLVTPVAK